MSSPAPGSASGLDGVAAGSTGSAWAVGSTGNGLGSVQTLNLRWNGTAWSQPASPNPLGSPLFGVAAISANSAWAVGCAGCEGGPNKVLIERWNGSAWVQVPSPAPAGSYLYGVAATSAGNAWAVGYTSASTGMKTLIMRWNGTGWTQVPSPTPSWWRRVLRRVGGLGRQRLGGRLRQQVQPDPDRAVEWQDLDARIQPGPCGQHPNRRGRRLGRNCVGGGQRRRRPDLDRAVERHQVDDGVQPEPPRR